MECESKGVQPNLPQKIHLKECPTNNDMDSEDKPDCPITEPSIASTIINSSWMDRIKNKHFIIYILLVIFFSLFETLRVVLSMTDIVKSVNLIQNDAYSANESWNNTF